MTPLHLFPLSKRHLPAIVELDRTCFGGLWTAEGYQRELDSPNSELWGISAQPAQTNASPIALGCFWAILDEAHITIVAVHPGDRRRGLGQWLVWKLLAAARQRGLARATLEVNANNLAARSLYARFGFREAGRRRKYYSNGDDALILWLSGIQKTSFLENLNAWDRQIQARLAARGWQI